MALFAGNRTKRNAQRHAVVRTLDRIAAGDPTEVFSGNDELSVALAPSIRRLQEQLVAQRAETAALGAALQEMQSRHTAGAIDYKIPAGTLSPACGAIAADINALVQSHIDVKMKVVRVVTDYANGDFTVDMDRLPGIKAHVTAAVDRVKTAFIAVSGQVAESDRFIEALAEMMRQHEAGWIDEIIPVDAFAGGYKRAADLVNRLVGAHIAVKMKIVDLITRYAHGDFSIEMDRLPGKKAQITEAMDAVRSLLPRPEDIAGMRRVQAALDSVTANVMLADADNVICYMNAAVKEMLRNAERDLQKDLPNLRVDRLLTTKIAEFNVIPADQLRMLADLRGTHRAEIVVGGRTLALIANPVADESGKRIGAVIEWKDRTLEVQVENETAAIVQAAAAGDFSRRLASDGQTGFFKILAQSMNELMETSDTGLNDVVRVLAALAKGDLTQTISADYAGTFGRLKSDSNATVENLTRTVVEIKEAAEIVSTSAREIAAGNTDLSQRTEEQAASLEETAASMEQLTATVRQNADNAKEANGLAIGASDIAVKGGQVVGEVVVTMAAINASAKKIVDIISVIDGIAFQTNILALNAAVEAARAGEQGRGFAVVAGEVRNLAQRSAAAAKEIKALIGDSVDKTATGSMLVDQAGQTMAEIVAAVKRVTNIMSAIAAASEEQGTGIEQVNEAVTQMDQVTQQNAALVEQIAASAESLEERSQALVGLVGVFTVASGARRSQAPAAPRPAARRPATPVAPAAAKHAPLRAADDADWSSF